jgi:PP-loop superfamily ATP-utilizing enzyme
MLKNGRKTGDLKELVYADDVMIWGNKIKVLEDKVNEWNNISKEYGLKINLKTVMLKISRNQTTETMKLDGKDIKEEDTFTYLSSCINKNGKIQNEINERIRKASNFHHLVKGLIRNRDINNKCKIDIYKVYYKKICYKGDESWTCTKKVESKIQAMEMKCLRGILGKTKGDKIRNNDI